MAVKLVKKPWLIPIALTIIILFVGHLYTKGNLTQADTFSLEEIQNQLQHIYGAEVSDLKLNGDKYEGKIIRGLAEYMVEVDPVSGKVLNLIQIKETTLVQGGEVTDHIADKNIEKGQIEPVEQGTVVKDTPKQTNPSKTTEKQPSTSEQTNEIVKQREESNQSSKNETNTQPSTSESGETDQRTDKITDKKEQVKEKKNTLISEEEAIRIGLSQLPQGMIGEVDDVEYESSVDGGYYLVEIEIVNAEDGDLDEVTYQIHAISGKVLTTTWDD